MPCPASAGHGPAYLSAKQTYLERKTLKQKTHYPRWRALQATLGLCAATVASLALASAATAQVIIVSPDNGSGSNNLGTAIATANTNASSSNTLVLEPGTYQPATQPITITKNLNIMVDHSLQASGNLSGADIQGALAEEKASNNLFVIPSGVSVRMDALGCDTCGAGGFAAVQVSGHLTWNGVESLGDPGAALHITSGGSATINESGIEGDLGNAVYLDQGGSLTLNSVSLDQGSGSAIIVGGSPYTLNINNTLIADNAAPDSPNCNGGGATNGGPGSLDDDGTCNVQYSNNTDIDNYIPSFQLDAGGPTSDTYIPANPDTTGKGVNCPTVDERFFVNPVVNGVISCDIGAITNGATQQTTPPSCQVTSTNEGTTPATQQVAVQDGLSGIGPEPGLDTDNPSNSPATAYPPPAAVPVPGYAVSNLQISNGTVALTPFTSVSTGPLVLTASKTTPGTVTQWSFTALNWAGISKNCY